MPYSSSGLALIQSWGYELVFIKASFVGDTVVMPARCAHEGVKRTAIAFIQISDRLAEVVNDRVLDAPFQ